MLTSTSKQTHKKKKNNKKKINLKHIFADVPLKIILEAHLKAAFVFQYKKYFKVCVLYISITKYIFTVK